MMLRQASSVSRPMVPPWSRTSRRFTNSATSFCCVLVKRALRSTVFASVVSCLISPDDFVPRSFVRALVRDFGLVRNSLFLSP